MVNKKRKLSPPREGEEVEAKVVVEAKDKNKDEKPTEEKSVKEDKINEKQGRGGGQMASSFLSGARARGRGERASNDIILSFGGKGEEERR
jgi:hypothetical protein